ncbi:hypothetical protein GCM10027511_10060 [Hymenobacter humi]
MEGLGPRSVKVPVPKPVVLTTSEPAAVQVGWVIATFADVMTGAVKVPTVPFAVAWQPFASVMVAV